jgi:gas vesicle protein
MRGFLFGMALGALAGMLYAPATGNRTRALIRDKYTRYSGEATDFIDRHSRDLSNRMEGVKHDVNLMLEQAGPLKERMIGYRDDMKLRFDEMRGRMEEKATEVRGRLEEKAGELRGKMDEMKSGMKSEERSEDQFRESA